MSKNNYKVGQIWEFIDINNENLSIATYKILGINISNICVKFIDSTRYSRYKKGENAYFMLGSFMDEHSILVKDVEPENKKDDKSVNKYKVGQIYIHKDESGYQDAIIEITSVNEYPFDDDYYIQYNRLYNYKDNTSKNVGSFDANSVYSKHCILIRDANKPKENKTMSKPKRWSNEDVQRTKEFISTTLMNEFEKDNISVRIRISKHNTVRCYVNNKCAIAECSLNEEYNPLVLS